MEPPPAKKPRRRRPLPDFLRRAEIDALLDAAAGERDRVLVLTGLLLALRVSSIVGLRIEDIDFDEATVLARRTKGGKDLMLPLPDALALVLRHWIGERRIGWLFPSPRNPGKPLTRRAVGYLMARLKTASGILRPCHPHILRHSAATHLLRNGVPLTDVSRILGHSSLTVTARYLHLDPSALKAGMDRLSFGRKPEPPPAA